MKLLVLSGGFGTRLQSAVSGIPKALAPIGHIPLLLLQIVNWKEQGIRSFVFLLHHQAELIINFLNNQQNNGVLEDCDVSWVVEPMPMDTGGSIAYAVKELRLDGTFLATNADSWLGSGIGAMMKASPPAIAIVKMQNSSRYGGVVFNRNHCITAFHEKNTIHESSWISAGLYLLNAEFFNDWNQLPFSLERHFFPTMVANKDLRAVELQTDFIDIGIPDDYYRFCRWIELDREIEL